MKPKSGAKASTPAATPANLANSNLGRWEQEGGNPSAIGVGDLRHEEHVPQDVPSALSHGKVVIAAITSCTNTSNPSVMIAAGLLAKKAVDRGLQVPAWVKTSLAPGSMVVRDYLERAGLTPYLEKLKFHIVGYGCTTCIGNSGPLPAEISQSIDENELVVASVLSGNRNFEGRINPDVRANYLMSPPLVVAFALAGRIDIDVRKDPLGHGKEGKPCRKISARTRREACRLQLLRFSPWKSRGHGARHLRQCPPAQQNGPEFRRRIYPASARRRRGDHLRSVGKISCRSCGADRY